MAGFTNFNKLKPGEVFTVNGEHFRKINELWYKSIENAPLGESMMTHEFDAKINQPVADGPAKADVDCSAKIVDNDGKRIVPPSARALAAGVQTLAEQPTFKSKSEAKRVTALKAAKAKKVTPRKKAAKKQAKRKK